MPNVYLAARLMIVDGQAFSTFYFLAASKNSLQSIEMLNRLTSRQLYKVRSPLDHFSAFTA